MSRIEDLIDRFMRIIFNRRREW